MPFDIPQEPRTQVDWVEIEDVPIAAIPFAGITVAELPAAFDAAFPALMTAIGQSGIEVTIPALAIYHGDPMDRFDLDVACALAAPLPHPIDVGEHTIRPGLIPAADYATVSHLGSYDGLGAAWAELVEAVRGGGAEIEPIWIEVYVTDPAEGAPQDQRTDLWVPVVVFQEV